MNPLAMPKLAKHVNDYSNIFSSSQVENLSRLFVKHENNTTEQVVTLFIPHREGNELLDIGLKVFNENEIGQKNLNNGLLLIIATEEKKLRIVVGKGMELKYTDMICRGIVENHLRPLLNEDKYEELIQKWGEIVVGATVMSQEENIGNKNQNTNQILKRETIQRYLIYISLGIIPLCTLSIVYPIFGELLLGILGLIGGIIGICSGIYFFKTNTSETKGTKIVALLIIFGLCLIPLNFGIQQIYCQFNTSTACTIWNTPKVYPSYNGRSDGNSYNDSSYSSDWSSSDSSSSYDSSSSSFGGGGGSSNGGGYGD